jgi:hypothetical protein
MLWSIMIRRVLIWFTQDLLLWKPACTSHSTSSIALLNLLTTYLGSVLAKGGTEDEV